MMIRSRIAIALLLILHTIMPLHAEELSDKDNSDRHVDGDGMPGLFGLRFVLFGQDFPAYASSADQNLTILPIPYPVYRGKFLRFGEDLERIADGQLLQRERLKLSVGASASFPEDSGNLSGRAGMPDLVFLLEAGPELSIAILGAPDESRELRTSFQLRAAVSLDGLNATGRGFVFNPELEYLVRDILGSKTELRLRVSPIWASRRYMDFFYGVGADYATPLRPEFSAESGYLNTEFLVGINRHVTDRLEFRGSVRLWANAGGANDRSPLYQRDYDRGVRLALYWTAWESRRRAVNRSAPERRH